MAVPQKPTYRPPGTGFKPGGGNRPKGNFRGRFQPQKEAEHRINHFIRVPQVRLVGDNVEQGIYPTQEALKMAQDMELDLVEISPKVDPPVCRIIDYNKFLYDKKKKEKELKAKSKTTEIKEIRFTPNTDDHDFDFKAKHAEGFLKEGNKVKAYVQFKGRAIQFQDRGQLLLLKFAERLAEFGTLENMPKLEGRRMLAMIAPKPAKKK
ncbi:translation initiation factor IF-3 [Niabella ginsenosidivorans]|uniref:Translation initiation factor IF-3 n=1 Tax=Niabella ginsenosidivorans TaxID=1176587 RepID=A0A1A9HZN2_9BACT|nr:translation initiation factor IF-3 [Niabella ginsenosidivorans]ANH80535.1 translation initiation factor IF-3 [Niabella ginsenosidivorans]